jgi:hypothetical protein
VRLGVLEKEVERKLATNRARQYQRDSRGVLQRMDDPR